MSERCAVARMKLATAVSTKTAAIATAYRNDAINQIVYFWMMAAMIGWGLWRNREILKFIGMLAFWRQF